MKWLLPFLFPFSALAGWVTNSTVPAVTNLGALIASCTQERSFYFIHTNGDEHVFLPYYQGAVDNIVDVNLTQNTIRNTNAFPGRFSYYSTAYSNGWFYFDIGQTINVAGTWRGVMAGYNVQTGETNIIKVSTYEYPGYGFMQWGDDGWLYMGSYGGTSADLTGSYLERYDPSTATFQDIGLIDTNHTPLGTQYAYTIGADTRYCYIGIRDDSYYLASWDSVTGIKTNFWYQGYGDSSGDKAASGVYRGKAGGWFYLRSGGVNSDIGNGSQVWYALSNGIPNVFITNANWHTNVFYMSGDATNNNWRAGVIGEALVSPNSVGYNFDMNFAVPDSSNNVAIIGYKKISDSSYTYLTTSNFSLAVANLKMVYPDGANLFTFGDYLPWLRYAPSSAYVTRLGISGTYNVYDATSRNALWYCLAYDAGTFVFDESLPWTFSVSTTNKYDVSVNPHLITFTLSTHEMYPCWGSDGFLYGCSYSRVDGHGEFGWCDLVANTNSAKVLFDVANAPAGMVSAASGTKLIYISYDTNALRVFDVATKAWVATNYSILPQMHRLDRCIDVGANSVVGIASNCVWKYDVTSDTVTYTNVLPAQPWSGFTDSHPANHHDKVLNLGPDGYPWLTLGNDLYRINPVTCIPQLVKTNVAPHNVVFNGGDCYLYNGTELHVLKDLLLHAADAQISTLRVGTMRMAP